MWTYQPMPDQEGSNLSGGLINRVYRVLSSLEMHGRPLHETRGGGVKKLLRAAQEPSVPIFGNVAHSEAAFRDFWMSEYQTLYGWRFNIYGNHAVCCLNLSLLCGVFSAPNLIIIGIKVVLIPSVFLTKPPYKPYSYTPIQKNPVIRHTHGVQCVHGGDWEG